MISVNSKEGLKRAIAKREQIIVVKGKLAKKLRPLAKARKAPVDNHHDSMNKQIAIRDEMTTLSAAGISVAVAITLIITVGIVAIVAIYNDYYMKISGDEIILEKK